VEYLEPMAVVAVVGLDHIKIQEVLLGVLVAVVMVQELFLLVLKMDLMALGNQVHQTQVVAVVVAQGIVFLALNME
jgi:hypothetical protein